MQRAALSGSALRALPAITSGVARGLSSSAIQASLAAGGVGVRRQDLLEAIRSVRGAELAADHLKAIRRDFRPDPGRLPFAHTKTLRAFAYVVRLDGSGLGFDAAGQRFVTVSSSVSLSRADIEAQAESYLDDDPEGRYAATEVTGLLLVSAVQAGRGGTLL